MGNKIIGFIIIIVVIGGAIWGATKLNFTPNKETKLGLSLACNRANGRWLADFQECEGDVQELCQKENGKYFECESACRHDGVSKVCTMQCIAVCKF